MQQLLPSCAKFAVFPATHVLDDFRLDLLLGQVQLDALLQSGAKFSESIMVLMAHRKGEAPVESTRRIGSKLVFARLWEESQIPQVIQSLLAGRRFKLPIERILFLTVLHRLFSSGTTRSQQTGEEISLVSRHFFPPMFRRLPVPPLELGMSDADS